ncbi:unnamed protein product [Heterobilharzia americana]|nr:unnamed protein product [Heterobilharzia americana]
MFQATSQVNSNVYSGGFRYHVRRPVESWKFFETKKNDGSKVYLCRLCGSSYKHKKSLNKHWRDKHYAELMSAQENCQPDGELDNDGDDEDGREGGDGDDSGEGDANKLLDTSDTRPLSSVENVDPDKVNSRYVKARDVNSAGTSGSLARIYSTGSEDCENRPPGATVSLSGGMGSVQNGVTVRNENAMRDRNVNEISKSGHLSVGVDHRDRLYANRRRLSAVPCSPSIQPRPRGRVSECVVKRVRSPNGENVNVDSKRRHSVFSSVREECSNDVNEKCSETSCYSNRNTPDGEMMSNRTNRSYVNCVGMYGGEVLCHEVEPLDLSVVRSSGTQIDCVISGRGSTGTSGIAVGSFDVNRTGGLSGSGGVKMSLEETVSVAPAASSTQDGGKNRRKEPRISRTLLIGLLQTALSTLENEIGENVMDSCESGVELSATSSSLLLAIGSLLITLADMKPNVLCFPAPGESCGGNKECVAERVDDESRSYLSSVGILTGDKSTVRCYPVESFQAGHDGTIPGHCVDRAGSSSDCGVTAMGISKTDERDSERCLDADTWGRRDNELASSCESDYADGNHKEMSLSGAGQEVSFTGLEGMKKCDGSEAVIICPVCKFGARWFSELRAHMVNHSEHRMFGCCYCHYRAKWKWDVAKHMRRCPLGRHVSHLQNEALLRIVRYHPPPEEDILYSYFPQNGFPGVGVDHPPTPPKSCAKLGYERVRLSDYDSKDCLSFGGNLRDGSGSILDASAVSGRGMGNRDSNLGASTSMDDNTRPCRSRNDTEVSDIVECDETESCGLVIVEDDGECVDKSRSVDHEIKCVDGGSGKMLILLVIDAASRRTMGRPADRI